MIQENRDRDQQKPWALVTGASAGIGAEFCRQLAGKGYQLVLVARRDEKLRAIADELMNSHATRSLIIAADLSQKDACETIVERLALENISIEYLVNNAGYGLPGSFHVPSWQEHADFIQVMMTAVCELTWRLLPGMQERGRGFIVNVASVAGLVASSAGHTLYGASKSFLIRFSEALALENEDTGVKVCALCPGFTYSEFHDVNGTREMISKLPAYLWLDAKDVVADTVQAMSDNKVKPVVIPGRQYKMIVFANRYLPWLASILVKRNAKHFRVLD
ncbi:MAG: SDR family oxidoreductase [Xanthomonadales bacterium]|nr:SDR family oxidoreductase [Xanthomonadales bacterium]